MQAENYTQNLSDWSQYRNNGRGGCGLKRAEGTISKRAYERLIREAKRDFLSGFDIDWSKYGEPTVTFYDMLTAQIEWPNLKSGQLITLTHIWFERKTGEILQAGSNHGSLTL
ncbi:hypothetical protein HOT99_gp143 [Caulobacter phage CcrBL10]|uniref:Uncharacterized protein n=1 Tax=Caulobacter phage CcrBL10 TaxID=2283269 RepID=A0A385E9F4_9CAUD|nr:hypothetical protein HOT99_gp143 [Caulobacter phage CcrBL10]AXQ68474.1 hypothetical protein CcrBL10_gp270 [Caulobacter phage CcrBL10]